MKIVSSPTVFSRQNARCALRVHSTSLAQTEVAVPLRNKRSHFDYMYNICICLLLYIPSIYTNMFIIFNIYIMIAVCN